MSNRKLLDNRKMQERQQNELVTAHFVGAAVLLAAAAAFLAIVFALDRAFDFGRFAY